MKLYHGSKNIVREPVYGFGSPFNDYGLGFYCTEHIELAKEWACPDAFCGYANYYEFHMDGMSVLRLEEYSILHWLALLVQNRRFQVTRGIMEDGKKWLLKNYLLDLTPYDVIIGYRADDSYFQFAKSFLANSLSLEQLAKSMELGELGEQVVLTSEKAFQEIHFLEAFPAEGDIYYSLRQQRDQSARDDFQRIQSETSLNGMYLLDLMRKGEFS